MMIASIIIKTNRFKSTDRTKAVVCCLFLMSVPYVCMYRLFLVRFRLLSGHLLEIATHSVDHMFLYIFNS